MNDIKVGACTDAPLGCSSHLGGANLLIIQLDTFVRHNLARCIVLLPVERGCATLVAKAAVVIPFSDASASLTGLKAEKSSNCNYDGQVNIGWARFIPNITSSVC